MIDQHNQQILQFAIRYSLISIGFVFSFASLLIIMLQKLYTNKFILPIAITQLGYLLISIIDFSYFRGLSSNACNCIGFFYYSFWLICHLSILSLLFIIFALLLNKYQFVAKYSKFIIVGIAIAVNLPGTIQHQYDNCYKNGENISEYFCGYCGNQVVDAIYITYSLNFILPILMGVIFYIAFTIYKNKINMDLINNDQKIALKIIYIPLFNLIFIIIAFTPVIIDMVSKQKINHDILMQTMNNVHYLIPFANFLFFIQIIRKFDELFENDFKYFACLRNHNQISQSSELQNSIFG